jgi:hypothetical protein
MYAANDYLQLRKVELELEHAKEFLSTLKLG